MKTIAICFICLALTGCVQNAYERPYFVSHQNADDTVQEEKQN